MGGAVDPDRHARPASCPRCAINCGCVGWMAGDSTEKLEVADQYWQLVAQPGDPWSGDFGYSEADMRRFGAGEWLRPWRKLRIVMFISAHDSATLWCIS